MRLHDFILGNQEQILQEWEVFASTCTPASDVMDVRALRDHAKAMLLVIAADLKTAQNQSEQTKKSKGQESTTGSELMTAAEEHGAGRAESGFTVEQMVAEYRALRASVIRLWTREQGELKSADIDDLTRFNEAIDQALAESVAEFNENIETAKEMFLAILGHDLRTPLGAIYTSATFMLEADEFDESHISLLSGIVNSATRTMHMVGDLLDFTRSRLGGGIPVVRSEVSVGKIMQEVADEVMAAHPQRQVQVETGEEEGAELDAARISQALTNLIGNALEHGTPEAPVTVGLKGDDENVEITIHNRGAVIPAEQLDGLFNPMKVKTLPRKPAAQGPGGNLGLGLYIAERIVNAHQGRIEVESLEGHGTTFTVHLPRR